MDIRVCRTFDVSDKDWEFYVNGYNSSFMTNDTIESFKNKYKSTFLGYSFHSFLLSDEGHIVGGVSALPCMYINGKSTYINGLAVDTFIHPRFRKDPTSLYNMYNALKNTLAENGVSSIVSIPNAISYPYWKKAVKWKDIGDINYWIVPVRMGNVFGKGGCFLNALSLCYSGLAYIFSKFTSLFSCKAKSFQYYIDRSDVYIQSKLNSSVYGHLKNNNLECTYSIVDEDGVKTAYILDASKNGKLSAKSLSKVVGTMLKEKVDIIIYVGKMSVFQTLFVKVPKRFEPKRLPLMIDIIDDSKDFSGVLDINNWDYGLINYDVR